MNKAGLSHLVIFCRLFQGDFSVAILLCALIVSYVALLLFCFFLLFFGIICSSSLFFWCLGEAVLCGCGISWVSSLIFFNGPINISDISAHS